VKSLNVSLNLAIGKEFVLHTPLMWLDKKETWELADRLGRLDYVKDETLTCYHGIPGDGCGECPACKLRRAGYEQYMEQKERKEL
jgi:7-cyano-7-deazaguanine synthase